MIFNRSSARTLAVFMLVFITVNVLNSQLNKGELLFEKLIACSFGPWLYMFLLGALLFRHPRLIALITRVPFLLVLLIFLAVHTLTLHWGWGNDINPIGYLALTVLVVKCAFSLPRFSDLILHRNDFSYGIYIMHMPIVNYMLTANIVGQRGFFYTLLLTIALAMCSWFLIERPCLKMKKFALRSMN